MPAKPLITTTLSNVRTGQSLMVSFGRFVE